MTAAATFRVVDVTAAVSVQLAEDTAVRAEDPRREDAQASGRGELPPRASNLPTFKIPRVGADPIVLSRAGIDDMLAESPDHPLVKGLDILYTAMENVTYDYIARGEVLDAREERIAELEDELRNLRCAMQTIAEHTAEVQGIIRREIEP